jgi:hypothetical protein
MKTIAKLAWLLGTAVACNAMADSLNVCINKKTGVLRSARNCNAKETRSLIALESAGTNGAIGPAGAKGETGPQGPAGVMGPKGETGLQGVAGAKGETGLQGVAGAGATVFDANGQKLGILGGFFRNGESRNYEGVNVYDKSTNLLVNLRPDPVDPTIMRPDTWNTDSYAYSSADCSGEPLLVFDVSGNGNIRPNRLDFFGERLLFDIVYAEATTNETTGIEDLSGKYLTLGGQVSKQVNETDTSVTASSSLIGSVKGEFVYRIPSWSDDYYYWDRKPTGCTPLTVTSKPVLPASEQGGYTYNGTSYSDWDSAYKAYELDSAKYYLYKNNNKISRKSTRWVFTYATTSAPFLSPVKLPLSFQ